MAKVNVVGSTLVDLIIKLPRSYLHKARQSEVIELPFGQKLQAESSAIYIGGSGANVASGLAKLGHETVLQTSLADDALGKFLRDETEKAGIRLEDRGQETPTQISSVLCLQGEYTILTGPPPSGQEFSAVNEEGWIHLGPLGPSADKLYQKVLEQKVRTNQGLSINPSITTVQDRPRDFMTVLRSTDVLVLNQREALSLTRLPAQSRIEDLIKAINMLGPKVGCVTCSLHGAYVGNGKQIWYAAALTDKNNRVDATGAGDAFTSGFLHGFWQAQSHTESEEQLKTALAAAMLNSGSAVSFYGAQAGLLTSEQIEKDRETVKLKRVDAQDTAYRW